MGLRLALLIMLTPATASAQSVVTSAAPDKVAVTIYREPGRGSDDPIDLQWLEGYALITETRRVTIPAGATTIRFEGVAAGMLPESAIVAGLPDGVAEKNQDAALLSPYGLMAASTLRPVTVRRTNKATGAVSEEQAVLRSGPNGGAVLQTRDGFEALRCGGANETIVHDGVPPGLSAKPTLSVRTESSRAAEVDLTLSYLAYGFDWQANYVATLSKDEKSLDLLAWVTLANGDETSFPDAETQTVAGKVNSDAGADPRDRYDRGDYFQLRCWPAGNTGQPGDYDAIPPPPPPAPPPPPPVPAPAMAMDSVNSEIVVTGSRIAMKAVQEELGDLKLYRIPEPVTVAANSQKQVAMIDAPKARADIFYRARIRGDDAGDVEIMARLQNRKDDGLGMPLPAGQIAIFKEAAGRPMLLGEADIDDKAVGEEVEFAIADATGVDIDLDEREADKNGWRRVTLTVTNDHSEPVRFEAEIMPDPNLRFDGLSGRTREKDGKLRWIARVRGNGTAVLRYRIRDAEDEE